MWFKRETRNRRLHRGHVLDVKLRSDRVRAARTRLAAIAFGVTFGTLFGLYLFWRTGEWALDRFVYENSAFAIQTIEVQTDGVIASDELRRWSNVKPGSNLIALDTASVRRNLELVPAIASARIERVLPRTLKIWVTERVPVAQVNVPALGATEPVVYQLDRNGYVMKPLDPRLCAKSTGLAGARLTVLTGLNVYDLQPGRRLDSPSVQAALALIAAFAHSPMAGLADLRRVDVMASGVVVATTEQGGEITFALNNFEQQLGRWRKIYDLGRKTNRAIAAVDLAVSNNVPVRWITAGTMPVPPPKHSRPATSWKRNV